MRAVIRWAISNSPAMNMILIASLLIGSISLIVMKREIFPEFQLEILLVAVPYPGASPEDTEQGICQPIESALFGLDGVKKMTAVARENVGYVILELNNNVRNVQKVLNEVDSKVKAIDNFPQDIEIPDVEQIVFRNPAITIGIIGPENSGLDPLQEKVQLRALAEEVRNDLLQLEPVKPANLRAAFYPIIAPAGRPAVSSAEIVAAQDYQIDVEVSEESLRNYGMSLQEIAARISSQSRSLAGGTMDTTSNEVLLSGSDNLDTGEKIKPLALRGNANGEVVRVQDVANVIDGFADTTSRHFIDGRPGIVINVTKTSQEDMLTVVDSVKAYVEDKKMPEGYELKVWRDLSVDVRDRINMLSRNGLQGLILVFIVLAVFLDLRLAFWVALGIPVSILGAGFILILCGQTLNMLSMFAFLMALGIVVDDAIVIGENIYSKRKEGLSFVQASIEGTYEVLPSVCASVTTTIIAFLPLMFITGVMGKFIAVMPVAVIAMLVISLVESMFILPCHLAHENNLFLRMVGGSLYIFKFLLVPFRWVNNLASKFMEFLIEFIYLPVLRFALFHKLMFIAASMAFVFGSIGLGLSGIVPFEAFPTLDTRYIAGTVVFPDGANEEFTQKATVELENAIYRVNERIKKNRGEEILDIIYRKIGEVGDAGGAPTGVTSGSHVGSVDVELTTTAERSITSDEIISMWREEMPEIEGVEVVRFSEANMGPGGNAIEFRLMAMGDSTQYLEEAAERCKKYLETKKGVSDIEDDSRVGKLEMIVEVNDQGKALGLTEDDVYNTIRASYFGLEVSKSPRAGREVRVMVRYPEEQRRLFSNFQEIRIRDSDRNERPVTSIADIRYERSLAEISRLNQKRSVTITAAIDKEQGANAAQIVAEMKTGFVKDLLDEYKERGVVLFVNWEGQAQQTSESFTSMQIGFLIAMFCMYILLTLEFRSYLQPLIILFTIPFGCIGAIGGHAIMGLELTLFSFFGLIALTGVIVNDSIVLVDFINHRVRAGMSLNASLIEAGRRRFRPVMLTSFTTIAGLFPMLLETSFQAHVLIPMAASLVFGLASGTVFILVLVPVFYKIYGWMLGMDTESWDDAPPADEITEAIVRPNLT